MISFTKRGDELNILLRDRFIQEHPMAEVQAFSKCSLSEQESLLPVPDDLQTWTGERFGEVDAILFIGATGIAVRAISPFVAAKTSDPAILVVGDRGQYMISLLAGHLGGANDLAIELAAYIDALPVITTATDNHHKFAVDIFARDNHLKIKDMTLAKYISVEVLHEHPVCLYTDMRMEPAVPAEVICRPLSELNESAGLCMIVSDRKLNNRPIKGLQLVPRDLIIGIGCRRGTFREDIELAVFDSLRVLGLRTEAIERVVSIDLKAAEPGLLQFAGQHGLTFETYSAERLLAAKGEFHGSEFVKQTTGVDNVCERSVAVAMEADGGEILREKAVYQGVTICVGRRHRILHMRRR